MRLVTADDAEAVAHVQLETRREAYAHAPLAEGPASLSGEQRADFHRFYAAAGWSAGGAMRLIEIFGIEVPEVRYRKTL